MYKNENYIGEIIIVDDGSNEQMIIEDAQEYFDGLIVSVKLLKNEAYLGIAKSLNKAVQEAKYDEIVIFDPLVVFSEGWLLPLLEEIVDNPKTIAIPHFDKISDVASWKYEPTEEDHIVSISWNLHTILTKINDSTDQASPSMRPDLFAINRSFLDKIGSIDKGFGHGGGEALELAMRAWCCGGSIKLVTCSRVAVANLHTPIKITSGINLRRLVGLWFPPGPNLVIPLSKNFQPSGGEAYSISLRMKLLSSLNCNNASWYFKEVLKKHLILNANTTRFGHLRARSGYCANVAFDFKVDMIPCEPSSKDEHTFQLTLTGQVLVMGKCLTVKPNSYVTIEECTNSQSQKWIFTEKLELFNVGTGSCATHVTDPDQATSQRQIVMAQSCIQEQIKYEIFKKWTFIPF